MRTATMLKRPAIPTHDTAPRSMTAIIGPDDTREELLREEGTTAIGDLPIGREVYENLSGTAGTGKTTMARALVAQDPDGVVLAATTGIAAVNLGEGTTINALLKYFDTASLRENYTRGALQATIRRLRRTGVTRILIDEKSMLSGQQLTLIARAVREVNEGGIYALESVGSDLDEEDQPRADDKDLPPIGLTLVGDFGQLPPVPDADPLTGKKIPIQYAFESPEWESFARHTTTLTKIWRQDAQDFVRALHAVRAGRVQEALEFFTPARFSEATDDRFAGTTIFAKNDAVERYNQLRLDELASTSLVYDTRRVGKQRGDWKLIPDALRLKDGALVMILANRRQYEDDDDERGELIYANGDLGILRGKADSDSRGSWIVELQRTGQCVRVQPVGRQNVIPLEPGRRKQLKEEGKEQLIHERFEIVGTVTYMPLRAAYGCTVHKTQGLTLDNVQVNIRDPFFRHPGMLFVALSRARTIDGLRIVGNQVGFAERCRVEPRVQPWL